MLSGASKDERTLTKNKQANPGTKTSRWKKMRGKMVVNKLSYKYIVTLNVWE